MRNKLIRFLAVVAFLLIGGTFSDVTAQQKPSKVLYKQQTKQQGPPPWAPAHDWRRKQEICCSTNRKHSKEHKQNPKSGSIRIELPLPLPLSQTPKLSAQTPKAAVPAASESWAKGSGW